MHSANYIYTSASSNYSNAIHYNDDYCPNCHVYNKIWYQTPESFQEYFAVNRNLKLCFNCASKKLQRSVSIRETRNKLGQIRKNSIY